MLIEISKEIEPTPREIADELWGMNSNRQAEFFAHLADIYESDVYHALMQMEYIVESISGMYDDAKVLQIERMLEELLDRVKGRAERREP